MKVLLRGWFAQVVVIASVLALGAFISPVVQADPDNVAQTEAWTAVQDGTPQYPGVHVDWDVPITMSDGTVIKANVYRPMDAAGKIVDTPLPTLVNMTPYTKLAYMLVDSALSIPGLSDPIISLINRFDLFNLNGTPFSGIGDQIRAFSGGAGRAVAADRKLVQAGYTEIVADVRGTGFSQGVWPVFGEREKLDTVEIVDWASRQPWSNGSVGLTGVSNGGISALQGAEKRPTALKAVFATVPGGDLLRDVVAPGGGFDVGFIPLWLAAVNITKWLPDLASVVNGRFDWQWLADRVTSPIGFLEVMIRALFVPSVDAIPADLKNYLDPDGPFRAGLAGNPDQIEVPTFIVGGWHDIFNNSISFNYNSIPLATDKKKLLVGNWYHTTTGSSLGTPGAPPRVDVLQRAWFDKWLKGIDNGIDKYSPTTLWQQGGGWTSSDSFPRPGMTYTRQYLSADPSGTTSVVVHDGSLSDNEPRTLATLTVFPGLANLCSRDGAQGTAGILALIDGCAKDSRIAETTALTFTSRPVSEPTEISGPVNVHLNTVLDATDGYWSVTLNDVAQDGTSTVLTTGQLTASLRRNDEDKSERSPNGDYSSPYKTLSLDDREPIAPGVPTVLDIGLEATDAILQPGHRLRVDIFAANFPKGMMLPALLIESQLKAQHLVLDPNEPSWVNVPLSRPV